MHITFTLTLALAILLVSTHAHAGPSTEERCKAYTIVDAQSGETLKESNSEQQLPPASMVKLMTLYTLFTYIDDQLISLKDQVPVSAAASKIGGSQVYLKHGETFSVKEMLEALMIQSANDAAHALAEFAAGSVEAFVEDMNIKAQKLGLRSSIFHTPHGLPASRDEEPDLASAADFAKLGTAILNQYPSVTKLTSVKEKDFRDGTFTMRNHNKLVGQFGIDGLKTGYHSKAGYNLVASAEKKGMRFVSVVMGCKRQQVRNALTAKLMKEAMAQVRNFDFSKEVEATKPVLRLSGAVPGEIELTLESPLRATLHKNDKENATVEINQCDTLPLPIDAGTQCGSARVLVDGETKAETKLLTTSAAREQTLMEKVKAKVGWK